MKIILVICVIVVSLIPSLYENEERITRICVFVQHCLLALMAGLWLAGY